MNMLDVEVISDAKVAAVALDPVRSRLLAELATPASASALAERFQLTRQKLNYHLKALERCGLVRTVEKRQWGGLVERLLQASAAAYVVSPGVMGKSAPDPKQRDRLSAGYLIALGARVVQELGEMLTRAAQTGQRLATFAIDAEVQFASAAQRAAFAQELTEAVTAVVARYHDESTPGGRRHRLTLLAYPTPKQSSRPSKETSRETSKERSKEV